MNNDEIPLDYAAKQNDRDLSGDMEKLKEFSTRERTPREMAGCLRLMTMLEGKLRSDNLRKAATLIETLDDELTRCKAILKAKGIKYE